MYGMYIWMSHVRHVFMDESCAMRALQLFGCLGADPCQLRIGVGACMPNSRLKVALMTGANTTSPHEALFHYCGSTLMAVRYPMPCLLVRCVCACAVYVHVLCMCMR